MNKRSLLPVLSTALLAPAFLAGQVYAEEATTPAESSAVIANPANSATSETPAAPTTEAASPTSAESTEAKEAPVESPKSEEKDTVILHTNDVHGRIVEEKGVIGDAKLATVIEQERAKSTQNTLVVDAGDAFQGLPISNSTKGEARAEILNQMQYDAMAVGNHEFDFGLDEAKKYKEILKFPLLSSNTYVNGARLFEASTIVDKDKTVEGDEFVVIGVTTPETATKTHPKNVKGVTFTDPISEVNKVIEEVQAKARAEGKDYKHYVVLAHLGVDTTTPVEWRGSTLAEALSKNPRLKGKRVTVIDGHSHTVASTTYGDNVTYNQTGSYLHNVGKVIYKSRQLLGNPTQIPAADAKKLPANPTVEKLVKDIKQKYDAENAVEIVSNSPVELNGDRENVRVRETNLGNVVADSLYQYGQTGFSHPTDIAVTNGGGLRETIAKGKPITKGNVIAVLPFGNTISQIQVTGQQVLDMFEKSLGSILQVDKDGKKVLDENGQPLLEPSGGFLQVSGVKVYYDTNLPSGKRVLAIQVKNRTTGRYDLLDLAKTYYLATNDFLAAGGDGYTMLGGAREEGPSMDAAFEEYLKTADLTQYEKINPNSRTISVDSKNFSLPVETPQTNAAASDATTNVPLTYEVAGQFSKKAVVSEKALPNTGSEQSIFLLLMGMVAGLAGILSSRKPKQK
ncbi:Trifunctional nucleotide phosphoesterase protein YfkN precursor [Streptococcus sp. BCA20]|uniref:cell surface ecto-5'-nucleotidase Nt5e n=1 Tax=Streptococcus oralis TaxID=1303 RepID=UPI000F665BF2|nr:cell surface ecto-5'-nucleotidase Nt5e [Streptococcus oralis]RSH97210.1 Trifunctional nucleotide phosphoesterase protein YfkN precursor [Streptococcus oralis]RSJ37122.1 Trifunctional nucleotide phosphoesterase protein YfkN precursor [Streptococcus sp. BCA20]